MFCMYITIYLFNFFVVIFQTLYLITFVVPYFVPYSLQFLHQLPELFFIVVLCDLLSICIFYLVFILLSITKLMLNDLIFLLQMFCSWYDFIIIFFSHDARYFSNSSFIVFASLSIILSCFYSFIYFYDTR